MTLDFVYENGILHKGDCHSFDDFIILRSLLMNDSNMNFPKCESMLGFTVLSR